MLLREKPTIVGESVTLRPVGEADADGLVAIDAEVLRLTGSRRVFGIEELRRWYATRADHDDRLDLAIVERATGRYAGEVVLLDLDPYDRSCLFRILLTGPEFFGRGLGTEATRLVLGHAFDTVGLHRVELEVFAFNPRARRVYEKVGFVHEGTRRQALHWDGEWIDAHVMAILAHEWATHRGHPDTPLQGAVMASAATSPEPELRLGQPVQVVVNEHNRTGHRGTVRDHIWHHKDRQWYFYLTNEAGRRVSKRYSADDLQPLDSDGARSAAPIITGPTSGRTAGGDTGRRETESTECGGT